jgi:CBF1 interacting corepressor
MSLKFLNLKSFHPTNKSNQRALFIAEETEKENKKKELEATKEFEAENENFKEKVQAEEEKQRSLQNLQNFRRKQERTQAERETALLNPDYKPPKKKRRPKKEKTVSKQLSFLYVQPPGLKAALEKEEQEKRAKLDIVDNSVQAPVEQKSIEEKFPLLKNAPKESNLATSQTGKITYKPFGIEIRNVRCNRCGTFGHTSSERHCPLYDYNPLDSKRRELEDPLNEMKKTQTTVDGNKFELKVSGPSFDNLILEEEQEENMDETGLSEKERKKLLKKYKKLKKKLKRKREDEEEEEE